MTTGRPREWSVEEDNLMRDLYLEGKSTAYLADRFDTTIVNVKQRLSRMGARRPRDVARTNPPRKPRPQADDIASRIRKRGGSRGGTLPWTEPKNYAAFCGLIGF